MKINNLTLNFSANKAFYTSFIFFILSFFLLFGLFKKIVPLTVSHAVYYCQTLFANTIITLPHALPSLFVILLLLVFSTGIFIFTIQIIKSRLLIAGLQKKKMPLPKEIVAVFKSLGIVNEQALSFGNRVDIVKDKRCLSFCYGFFKPRIILSSQLLKILTEEELKAVLIHEDYHLKNYDPLKIMLGQVASSMFWFLPVIKDFHNHFIVLKEYSADQLVIKVQGSAKNLKLALAKVVDYSMVPASSVVPFTSVNGLETRILHLINTRGKPGFRMSIGRLFVSSFVILLIFVFLNIPIYAIETGAKTHTYLICPTGGSCTGLSSCGKGQNVKEDLFSSLPMFTPLKYSSR